MRLSLAAPLFLLAAPAAADVVTGPATVSDGDSLSMTGTRIRLFGVDAPERDQTCRRGDGLWRCGQDSAAALAEMVADREVECERRDTDGYGRMVAVCRVGALDLAELMVGAGMAVALPEFSQAYVETEARARRAKIGLWNSQFDPPAAYRAAHPRNAPLRRTEDEPAPARITAPRYRAGADCAIKGNRNRRGQWIYHLPGMPYYDRTRAEEVFCTEAQAAAAGYRRAVVKP